MDKIETNNRAWEKTCMEIIDHWVDPRMRTHAIAMLDLAGKYARRNTCEYPNSIPKNKCLNNLGCLPVGAMTGPQQVKITHWDRQSQKDVLETKEK